MGRKYIKKDKSVSARPETESQSHSPSNSV